MTTERLIAEAAASRLDCDCGVGFPIIRHGERWIVIHDPARCPAWNGAAQTVHTVQPRNGGNDDQ